MQDIVATERSNTGEPLTLYHWGPSSTVPSMSSFVVKLETYLRMTNITYHQEFTFKSSSKGKMPYIKHKGKEIADTNFIIPYLNDQFSKDLNSSLSETDKAVALAFQRLIEENLYWTLVHYCWIENWSTFSKQLPITGIRKKLFQIAGSLLTRNSIRSNLQGHGMGRHTVNEIGEIMEKDLKALSIFLGSKSFLMGDKPTEVDASLFGLMAQIVYGAPGSPHASVVKQQFQNLYDYTERMKKLFFNDWDQKLSQDGKVEEDGVGNVNVVSSGKSAVLPQAD